MRGGKKQQLYKDTRTRTTRMTTNCIYVNHRIILHMNVKNKKAKTQTEHKHGFDNETNKLEKKIGTTTKTI